VTGRKSNKEISTLQRLLKRSLKLFWIGMFSIPLFHLVHMDCPSPVEGTLPVTSNEVKDSYLHEHLGTGNTGSTNTADHDLEVFKSFSHNF